MKTSFKSFLLIIIAVLFTSLKGYCYTRNTYIFNDKKTEQFVICNLYVESDSMYIFDYQILNSGDDNLDITKTRIAVCKDINLIEASMLTYVQNSKCEAKFTPVTSLAEDTLLVMFHNTFEYIKERNFILSSDETYVIIPAIAYLYDNFTVGTITVY